MQHKLIYIIVFTTLFITACGSQNQGTSIAGNSTAPLPTITIGKLTSDGKATITMPLAVFGGSEDNLVGASVDVSVNSTLKYDNINPESYYHSSSKTVSFTLASLKDGDVLTFLITVQSSATTYEGTVSGNEETEATNTLFGSGSESGVSPNITFVSRSDGSNEIAIASSAFGGVSAVDGSTLTLTFTYGDDSTVVKTISAADYYNALTQAVEFSPSELWDIDFFWEQSSVHGLGTDDSLIQLDLSLRLEDGASREHWVSGHTIQTHSDEDYTFTSLGFVGTSTDRFAQTYTGAMTLSNPNDCWGEDAPAESVETESIDLSVDQGIVSFDDFVFTESATGVVDTNGNFLIYWLWEGEASESYLIEMAGTIKEDSLQMAGTYEIYIDADSCAMTFSFESN